MSKVDIIAQLANPSSEYAMFSEAFYENTSFNVKLKSAKENTRRLTLTSQCHEYTDDSTEIDKAEPANQPRELTFNLLSDSVSPSGDIAEDIEEDFKSGNQFVILYTVYKPSSSAPAE